MRWEMFALPFLVMDSASAFSTAQMSTTVRSDADRCHSLSRLDLSSRIREGSRLDSADEEGRRSFDLCPEPDDDPFLDRREAAFAMLGRLWAAGAVPSAVLPAALSAKPRPAAAEYGTDAKIALPNPMEAITDRTTKQCIVESLGNRECLVYLDPANKLYQGADSQQLLQRIEKASEAMATIPPLIEEKKWSKVVGVMTGPMGTLGGTMDQLIKMSGSAGATAKAKKVKTDLYAIAAAAERKQQAEALKYHKLATDDLVDFVKSL